MMREYPEVEVCPGDLVMLRSCDHLDGLRPVQLRVIEVWPSDTWRSWVLISGREINPEDADRHGKTVSARAYKDALAKPGVIYRRGQTEVCVFCLRPAALIIECTGDGDVPACTPCGLGNAKGCPVRPIKSTPGATPGAPGDPTGTGRPSGGVLLGPC